MRTSLLSLILTFSLLAQSSVVARRSAGVPGNPAFTNNSATPTITASSPAIDTTTPSGPPLSLTLALICFCLIFLLIIGVIVLGLVARNQNITELNKEE